MTTSLWHTSREDLIAELERLQAEREPVEKVTQLIEAQRALGESRDRYVALYDLAPIGYMTLDNRGTIVEINLPGAALFGKERTKIQGLSLASHVQPHDGIRLSEFLARFDNETGVAAVEVALRTTAGERFVQLVGKRVTTEAGVRTQLLAAMIDLTEQRRLDSERKAAAETHARLEREEAIARARNEATDQFLAALSHELRTPLTPVVAALSDAELWTALPEQQRAAVELMRRNVDLEVHLIDDLLDVPRIARNRLALRRESVDVHDVVRDVVATSTHAAQLRHVTVATNLGAKKPCITGDATRLRHVFGNLLGNAIKFSEPRGVVTITSSDASSGQLLVSVADTGAGMDPHQIQDLFRQPRGAASRPMTSSSGLGLGLMICEGIVSAHGGTIHARSAGLRKGSTFDVALPTVERAKVAQVAQSEEPSAGRRGSLRILLVEDHPDTAEMLSTLLRFHGFEVEVAGSITSAISLATAGCDVLISDVRLPDGSGMELMRRLRQSLPVRGIAMSGFGSQEDIRRSKEAGYEEHLIKPVDVTRLIEVIHRVAQHTH
jgi:hypothetical protein